jgi:hypothetical protein
VTLTHILLVALVLLLVLGLLSWTATRLDRMNHRVETARAALQAALQGRSAVALELATSGLLDPASSLLVADAAHRARAAEPDGLIRAETDLTQALRAAIAAGAERDGADSEQDGIGVPVVPTLDAESLAEISHACLYVSMARRIYNDAVAHAVSLRGLRVVRWFRLAGHSVEPETIDFDDAISDLEP